MVQSHAMGDTITKDEVRAFWQQNPLMVGELELDPFSRAFFEAHERIYREEMFPGTGFPDSFFPIPAGSRVLDVGCGPGIWTRELARRGYRVSAIDLTAAAVEMTRRSLDLFGLKAEVQQADAENLPFPDGSFDAVVSHGVIHHTPDTERCVAEIARVLHPGGIAVVSVYYRNVVLRSPTLTKLAGVVLGGIVSLPGRGRSNFLRSGDPDEIVRLYDGSGNPLGKAYTNPEFKRMFTNAGLEVLQQRRFYFPSRAFGPARAAVRAIQPALAKYAGLMTAVFARKPGDQATAPGARR
jgi:2-polyprenyl-3-methyl-5-hydroxy-6-metoxy-1,4-benzoquinol methylase